MQNSLFLSCASQRRADCALTISPLAIAGRISAAKERAGSCQVAIWQQQGKDRRYTHPVPGGAYPASPLSVAAEVCSMTPTCSASTDCSTCETEEFVLRAQTTTTLKTLKRPSCGKASNRGRSVSFRSPAGAPRPPPLRATRELTRAGTGSRRGGWSAIRGVRLRWERRSHARRWVCSVRSWASRSGQ